MSLSPLTPSDPQRLGGYWLAGRLGAGGQGVVYEAYGDGGERVAVKVPRLDDAASRARLAKEAAAAQRVASFCTARVIEARTDVPEAFIVSEYVPGPNLRQVTAGTGPVEGDLLLRLAIGIATALTAIHEVGVVHRDLKPDNIILGPDGPRVIDFGVARQLALPATTTGPIMGTPNYMAPELFTGHDASAAADVWAWGLTVLHAATGHDPLPDGEPFTVVTRVLDYRPDTAALTGPLKAAVLRALAQDPPARPSARDLLLGLLGGLDGSRPADGGADRLLTDGGGAAATVRPPYATLTGGPDLGTLAEELYQELSENERAVAPGVFLRMVGVSDSGEESIRHVPRDELPDLSPRAPTSLLLGVYGAAGLVSETGAAFTLARPALVQAWPRFRGWLAEDRLGLPVHRRMTEAARSWDGHGRKPGDLLHGSSLARTLRWAAGERRNITLAPLERAFLDASSALARRTSRRRGALAAALSVLLVLALAGGGLAEHLRQVAARERDDTAARSLALRAADLRASDPRLAMFMSVAAWRLGPSLPQPLAALHDSMSRPETASFTDPDVTAGAAYATGPDGRTLVSVRSGQVTLWDVRGRRAVRRFSGVSPTALKAALSPDGKVLALQDDAGVRLWDVATGTALGGGFATGAVPGMTAAPAFDATGRLLAVPESRGNRTSAGWWDVARRRRIRTPSGEGVDTVNPGGTLGLVYSTGSGRAELWDLKTARRIPARWLPAKKDVKGAAFAAGGRSLAVTQNLPVLHGVRLLLRDARTGATLKADGAGPVPDAAAFGFHDRFLALWRDRVLTVLRLADGQVVVERELSSPVEDLRFDEADHAIRVGTEPGTVVTLDLAGLLDRPALPGSPEGRAVLAPGGRVLALYGAGTLRLLDVHTGRPVGPPVKLEAPSPEPPVMTFSPDGRTLALGGPLRPGGSVTLLSASDGKVLSTLPVTDRGAEGIVGLAFSPDGATLAVAPIRQGVDGPLELWDLARHRARIVAGVTGSAAMAYRPDGKLLVAAIDPEPVLVDTARLTRVARPGGAGSLAAGPYSFSPDGHQVAIGSGPARLSIWDAGFRAPRGPAFPDAGAAGVSTPVWSPDGRTIATYGAGDRISLWDVATRRSLGTVFDGLTKVGYGDGASLAFGADARTLVSATPDGVVRTHLLDGDRLAAAVCDRAGGAPDPREWRRDITEIDSTDVCPRP